MKAIYEYHVVCKTDDAVDAVANTREVARKWKRDFEKQYSDKYKIIQKKYVLTEEKEVR